MLYTYYMAIVKTLLHQLLEAIFPTFCVGCNTRGNLLCAKCSAKAPRPEPICFECGVASSIGVCPDCARRLHLPRTNIFWVTSFSYVPVRELIHTLKYRRAGKAAGTLGEFIFTRLKKNVSGGDIIIPVPMHASRLRERRANHAELIAAELARHTKLPVHRNVLLKIQSTYSQVAVRSRSARLKNLADSFAVNKPELINNKVVILIDDVLTTGATIIECTKTLRAAGVKGIIVIVVAH